MNSIVIIGVEVLESSSGDLYSVLNSYGFYQMATHVVRTDHVNEVYEFRKAKTSCCALRKPSLNFLVQEMRECRVSQEPQRERAAHSVGAKLRRLPVAPGGSLAASGLQYPSEADWGMVKCFRSGQFKTLWGRLV